MTKLFTSLINAGFEQKAAIIIEILMISGSSSAGILALRSKLKRPTVYATLDLLMEEGIITQAKQSGKSMFQLSDPKSLAKQLASKEKLIFENKLQAFSSLSKIIQQMNLREGTMFGDVKVERLRRLSDIQETVGNMISSGEFCAIFNPNLTTVGKMKEINKEFLRKTAISRPPIKEIIIDGKRARAYTNLIKNPHHLVKMLPEKTPYELDLIISKDSILIAQYGLLNENCISITHSGFALSFKTIFELLWGFL